jgi:polysaccharide export outer membrane protein
MKTTPCVSCLAAAAIAAFVALAPRPAAAGPRTDDKKPAAPRPDSNVEYRMGPGDKLRIEVYKDPQLSQSAQIRPDGKITMPLIGDVEAAGLTPLELRETLTASLKEFITSPTVTVIVVEATAATAYVMGEVNHPGAVNLQGPLTVMQALALAGGLKDFADAKNIRILRKGPAGTVQSITFNYKNAMKSAATPVYLRPGDTVVVPD